MYRFNHSTQPFHSVDIDGLILDINDAGLELLGYRREELLGRARICDLLTPHSRALLAESSLRLLRERCVKDLPLEYVHRDGSVIAVLVSSVAVLDAHGQVVGGDSLLTDVRPFVEARRRAEEAQRQIEARYRAVVEDQTELIARVRPDHTFVFVNEAFCRFFGRTRADLIGRAWQPMAVAEDVPRIEAMLQTLSASNPVVVIENRVCGADGEPRWMQFVNRALFDVAGNLFEIQAVGRDIDALKRMETALRQSNDALEARVAERTREVRRLAAAIVDAEENERRAIAADLHDDVGQLLHAMLYRLETLERRIGAGDCARDVGELIALGREAGLRVRSLAVQLKPPVLHALGLGPALSWLARELERAYGMTVEVDGDEVPAGISQPVAYALFRAVRELLVNVVKHARTLYAAIDVAVAAETLTIAVTDDGAGMAPADGASGDGLGLRSIEERIVRFGGAMRIESTVGRGTTVVLSMPLAQCALDAAIAS